jgi:hypothetical protein
MWGELGAGLDEAEVLEMREAVFRTEEIPLDDGWRLSDEPEMLCQAAVGGRSPLAIARSGKDFPNEVGGGRFFLNERPGSSAAHRVEAVASSVSCEELQHSIAPFLHSSALSQQ